ncbi:DUF4232 domain-containing protein [Streptomyces sp. NBC_01387]|uniref:DUF4232 domain-containing protein n=1 Tax=unclassified Streptomyces TaxID=2593676 RepID=UPI002E35D153|nr:DUF4232 domain-containing protein [Streptomyces sp. NBC_01267]WSV52675.1 DUF4232 domain-containing protein [Streptomyces sp. NBC_01014]
MLSRTARRSLPAVALVTAGLALTACGATDASSSSSPASSPSAVSGSDSTHTTDPTNNANTTDSQGTSPSSSTKASGTRSTSAAASGKSPGACATSRLRTTVVNTSSGAGQTGFQLDFRNTGTTPCTLSGYPGVSFVKIHNTQLGKAASRTGGATPIVTLIPNAHAYADVRTANGQSGYTTEECDLTTVPTLRVYPPNQTESTNIPWNRQECVGPTIQNLQVGPVHGNK